MGKKIKNFQFKTTNYCHKSLATM